MIIPIKVFISIICSKFASGDMQIATNLLTNRKINTST